MNEKLKEQLEKRIEIIVEEGIQSNNLEDLSKLIDIHKDLANEDYWKEKKEVMQMRYRGYSEYGNEYGRENYGRRGVPGTGRRRYRESGGNTSRYRGEEAMNEMYGAYQDYSEGREEMNMGNYSAKNDTMKSLEYMMESVADFIEMLKKDASSQEEMQLIQHYTRKISEM